MGMDDFYSADKLISNTVQFVIEDVFDGADIYDAINEELDRTLIYYSDVWKLLMHYQNPTEANYNEMVEEFSDDVYRYAYDYIDRFGSEDEEE